MIGEEASFFAICDGRRAVPLASAQDYKRAYDGDLGPNTGGMGCISPAPTMTEALSERIMTEIVTPTLDAMRDRGTPFQGVLYAGLMITAEGPKLIDTMRGFGDPECRVLMLRLQSDLLTLLLAAAQGELSGVDRTWSDKTAVTVVMAAKGYPGDYEKGSVIRGLNEAGVMEGVTVFHAGTKVGPNDEVMAHGGRGA